MLVLLMAVTSLAVEPALAQKEPPAIVWKQVYYGSILTTSNLFQTSDGGYIFMNCGYDYPFVSVGAKVFKVNSLGELQWSKSIALFHGSQIIQTNDGGFEASGVWDTYGTTYLTTAILIKLDSDGNLQWAKNFSANIKYETSPNAYSYLPNLVNSSNGFETSDNGFVFWENGYFNFTFSVSSKVIKTDSENRDHLLGRSVDVCSVKVLTGLAPGQWR